MSFTCDQNDKKIQKKIPNNQSIFFSGIDDQKKCDLSCYNYWTELVVNGGIEVPAEKPSIDEIDSMSVKLQIIRQKVVKTPALLDEETENLVPVKNLQNRVTTGRKLIIEGMICVNVSYIGKTEDQNMHTFQDAIPFSTYIVLPQYPEQSLNMDALDMRFNIVSCVESIVVKEYTDRDITLCIPFVLHSIPTGKENFDCLGGQDQGTCLEKNTEDVNTCMRLNEPIIKGICSERKIENILKTEEDNLWVEMFVPEIIDLPMGKPDIDEILSLTSKVDIICQKVVHTPSTCVPNYEGLGLTGKKLIIEAILRQRVTYTACVDGCQSIHSAHFDVPISAFIILPEETKIADKFIVISCIEDIFVCTLSERRIFKNTTLFFKATPVKCFSNCESMC